MPLASAAITLPADQIDLALLPSWLAAPAIPKETEAVTRMQLAADWAAALVEPGLESETISLCGYRLYQADYFEKLTKQCDDDYVAACEENGSRACNPFLYI